MALFDLYTTENGAAAFGGTVSRGQTFTASSSYSIESVQLKLFKTGTPGTVTVTIQETNGLIPTGVILATATKNGNDFLADPGQYEEFIFGSTANLSSGTMYAICVSSAVTGLSWRRDFPTPTYVGGWMLLNSGSGWTRNTSYDCTFKTYGTLTGTNWDIGTLVVTGIMSVILNNISTSFYAPTNIVTYKHLLVAGNDTLYYEDI
jgi:hypothetical protein